jgi:hypothetical protein
MEFINPHKRPYRKLKRKLKKAEKKPDVFCVALQSLDRVDNIKLELFRTWLDRITDSDFSTPLETSGYPH